ncbi:MAG: MFS transporter [Microbacteriaceae bacterium]
MRKTKQNNLSIGTITESPKATTREWFALAVLLIPVLLVSIDNTVLSFALPVISLEFNTTGAMLLWIVDSYALVLAGLLITMGSLGDRYGRRRMLLIGGTGFTVLSALAAFSPSAEALVGYRIGLGFFGAMLMPPTLSIIRNIFHDKIQRRKALAIWAAGFAAGSAIGPILGGLLLEHFHWGSVFLIAVPLLLLMLILTPWIVPESRDSAPGPIDLISMMLSVLALAPLAFGIKSLASNGLNGLALAALLLSAVSAWLFVKRQLSRPIPMLDMSLFSNTVFRGSVIVNLLAIFSLVGFLYFGSQHLQLILELSPLNAGLMLLPGLVFMILFGLWAVNLSRRVPIRWLVSGSLLLTAIAYALIAVLADGGSALLIAGTFVLLSIGIGISETLSNDQIVAAVPPEKAGAASAVSETAYEVGTVLGTAVLGSILMASYRNNLVLPEGLDQAQQYIATETLAGALNVSETLPADTAQLLRDSAVMAFDSGVLLTSGIAAGLMLFGAIYASFALKKAN